MSTKEYALFEVTPEIEQFAKICEEKNAIDKDLYGKYEVKRGLRDLNGKGVLAGLTNISDVCATKVVDGKEVPCAGNLYYRGYNIKDLVRGFLDADHYGFEEITYLLLFGDLPSEQELDPFELGRVEVGHAGNRTDDAADLRKRRDHEGAEPGYDEQPVPFHLKPVFL